MKINLAHSILTTTAVVGIALFNPNSNSISAQQLSKQTDNSDPCQNQNRTQIYQQHQRMRGGITSPRVRGSDGWVYRGGSGRIYDLNRVETIRGEVVRVDRVTSRRGTPGGIHLQVNTGKETVEVHLAPAWYLEERNIEIEPRDKIQITGSRIKFGRKPTIIAAKLRKGNQTLILRDENGFPVWSGWRLKEINDARF